MLASGAAFSLPRLSTGRLGIGNPALPVSECARLPNWSGVDAAAQRRLQQLIGSPSAWLGWVHPRAGLVPWQVSRPNPGGANT